MIPWFKPASGGSATTITVDDFEDNNLQVSPTDWSVDWYEGEELDQTALSVVTSPSQGSYALEVDNSNTGDRVDATAIPYSEGTQPSEVRQDVYIPSGISFSKCAVFPGELPGVEFTDAGDILVPNNGTDVGNYSRDTWYTVRHYNIDWSAGSCDVEVTDQSGTTAGSTTGVSFSGTSLNQIRYTIESTNNVQTYFDNAEFVGSTATGNLNNRLQHWWKLNEGSGSTAGDSRSSADLSITGASWTTTSKTGGYALNFDGTDDEATGSASQSTGVTGSLAGWFYPRRNGNSGSAEAIAVQVNASTGALQMETTQGGDWRFRLYDGSNNHSVTTPTTLDSWVHLCGVVTYQKMALYENGSLVATTTTNPSLENNINGDGSPTWALGNHTSVSRYFDGIIDDVRWFGRRNLPQDYANEIYSRTN